MKENMRTNLIAGLTVLLVASGVFCWTSIDKHYNKQKNHLQQRYAPVEDIRIVDIPDRQFLDNRAVIEIDKKNYIIVYDNNQKPLLVPYEK